MKVVKEYTDPVITEAILGGQQSIGVNALIGLQQNSRKLGQAINVELDKELLDFGFGAVDVNILSINYPAEVQQMAERVAGQSFVGNVGKYAAVQMLDSFDSPGGNNIASMGAQMAQQPVPQGANFVCTGCGISSTTSMKFCPDCGTQTV